MHCSMTETNVAAVSLISVPDAHVKPVTSDFAAATERKSQPWKAYVSAREEQPTEMFMADAPIRIIRGEELAPLLLSD